jgi:hypothetical protein
MADIITRSDERSKMALRALQGDQGVSLMLASDETKTADNVEKGAVVEVLATEQELADVLQHHNSRGRLWELAGGGGGSASAAEAPAAPATPPTIKAENAGKSA